MSGGPPPLPGPGFKPAVRHTPIDPQPTAPVKKQPEQPRVGFGGNVQSELQQRLAQRQNRPTVSIDQQIEMNRNKPRDSEPPERPSLVERSSDLSSGSISAAESIHAKMPYAALDSKQRIKDLMKAEKQSDSSGSEWSSSDSEEEEAPQEEVKELTLHEPAAVLGGWIEEITLEGQVYYRNEVNQQVRWSVPVTSQQINFDNQWVWIPHAREAYAPAKLLQTESQGKITVQKVGDSAPTELTPAEAAKCVPLNKAALSQITYVKSK
jgi:hypothetical protein